MRKLWRWFYALAILVTGIVASFFIARWAKLMLGLPNIILKGRGGTEFDPIELILMAPLLIAYLYGVPKLLSIDHSRLSRMLRGEE